MRPFASRFLAVSPVERVKRGSGGGVREEGGKSLCVVPFLFLCIEFGRVRIIQLYQGDQKIRSTICSPNGFYKCFGC